MKSLISTFKFSILLFFVLALNSFNAQILELQIEPVAYHSGIVGTTDLSNQVTYRVYAVLENENDHLTSIYGAADDLDCALSIHTTTAFYQNSFGGILGTDVNAALFSTFPELEFDSWLTIGIENSSDPGELNMAVGDPAWQTSFEAGGNIDIYDFVGSVIFAVNGSPNGYPDEDGRVLLAQLTTDGAVSVNSIGVQVIDENINSTTNCIYGATEINFEGCGDVLACNYNPDPEIPINNDLCCYEECGCTNPIACNFDPLATCYDGSCEFLTCAGCTDDLALNFDPEATIADASCTYNVSGIVYDDLNSDGEFNGSDYPLSFRTVTLQPENISVITDNNGAFSFNAVVNTTHEISVLLDDAFPFNTTDNPFTFQPEELNQNINLGVSKIEPEYAICVDYYPLALGYPCDDYLNHNVCYRNLGNITIDGYVVVEYNAPFQGHLEATPIDSVITGGGGETLVYMGFENLLPGEMFFYDLSLHTPTVDHIGEFVSSTASVHGFDNDAQVAFGTSELTLEVTCAYDPNDKQALPIGYAEPHFIDNGDEIEYIVRFQNTGNAPAGQVLIVDTLDVNLDIESFTLMANSHSVMTTINPENRVVEFLFENIQLPDSNCCEPDSHGLISYVIRPMEDLPAGTEINNTAYIFFDNNPEIVTNETWHTIYECTESLATIDDPLAEICLGEEMNWQNSQAYIENYNWSIDNFVLGNSSSFTHAFEEPGEYELKLTVDNPLCFAQNILNIYVHDLSEISTSPDAEICLGETTVLSANSEGEIEWNEFGFSNDIEVSPTETTTYQVSSTNEFGCLSESEITITVNALPEPEIVVGEDNILSSSESGEFYQWYLNGLPIVGAISSTYEAEEDGMYSVEVTNELGCVGISEEVEFSIVGVNENMLESSSITVFPNPMTKSTLIQFDCPGIAEIQVLDLNGKSVNLDYQRTTQGFVVNKSNASAGSYIIRLKCDGEIIGQEKLMIK